MNSEAGFTLIEALIAMAVLATGAVTFLTVAERNARLAGDVADRTLARWVASDRLTAFEAGLPVPEGAAVQLGTAWQVETEVAPTSDPGLVRVDVAVAPEGTLPFAPLYSLTGFVRAELVPEAGE